MNPKTYQLEKGDIILVPGEGTRPHVVEYSNYSRAYCLPLMTRQGDDGRVYDVIGPGVNIAPDSVVTVLQDSRKSANGSITDNLKSHPNYKACTIHPSTSDTTNRTNSTMQTQTTTPTPARRSTKAMTNGSGTTIKVPVDMATPNQRTVMTRAQRANRMETLTPATIPAPRVGCPRGSDISHVGLSCDGSGAQVPPHRYFTPGMDARFKGWMLKLERGGMKLADLPEVVRKSYQWEGVSELDETGNPNGIIQGVIGTTNYKGDDNPRYIELMAEGRTLGSVDALGRLKTKTATVPSVTTITTTMVGSEEIPEVEAPAKASRRSGRKAKGQTATE